MVSWNRICLVLLFSLAVFSLSVPPGPAGADYRTIAADSRNNPIIIASAKLPGGVSSRLKKAEQALDKAEKAILKGAGTAEDRAKRALKHLKKAKGFRAEIDKRYAGKFPPGHPDVQATDRRIARIESRITQGSKTSDSKEVTEKPKKAGSPVQIPSAAAHRLKKMHQELDRAEAGLKAGGASKGRFNFNKAAFYWGEITKRDAGKIPADHPEMVKAGDRLAEIGKRVEAAEGKAAAAAEAAEADAKAAKTKAADLSAAWAAKLKPFVEGPPDRQLNAYGAGDAASWGAQKGLYDEVKPLWDEYQNIRFTKKSFELQGIEQQLARRITGFEELYSAWAKKQREAVADAGNILFSKSPIDPANPSGLTGSFKTGDYIYALIQTKKPWKEIYGGNVNISIQTKIDGEKIHAQFIKIKSPEGQAGKTAPFEIAPNPKKMSAYGNPNFQYGVSKANLRQGPQEMSLNLGKLDPGRHTVSFLVQHYGKTYAQGKFVIEGDNFKYYAGLFDKYSKAAAGAVVLPQARMKNDGMEKEMRALLKSAGWKKIHRLNIVDKDWWLDRTSGGNSPIKSRHLDAAVLARDKDGYFYKIVQFHQDKLITGAWGKLYISHTGDRHAMPKANIDK